MSTYNITPSADGVKIELLGVGETKDSLLETLSGCADGSCACSTDEYQKVETMNISSSGDTITLEVTTKPGEIIDPACINDCLDYAQEEAAKQL